jgi:isocitrate/isopropylmalate dehydrogenase
MMPRPNPSSIAIKGPFPDPAIQVESARKARSVTLIPGDGIGPEVVDAAVRAIGATGVRLEWDRVELNASTISDAGGRIPQQTRAGAWPHYDLTLFSKKDIKSVTV